MQIELMTEEGSCTTLVGGEDVEYWEDKNPGTHALTAWRAGGKSLDGKISVNIVVTPQEGRSE